jgi:hypothetical protein
MVELLKNLWAKSRWVVWVIIGAVCVVALVVIRGFLSGKSKSDIPNGLPPIPKAIQDKVFQAEEDSLKARVTATVKAEEHKKQLAEVLKIDDGAERRKRLAEMLSKT